MGIIGSIHDRRYKWKELFKNNLRLIRKKTCLRSFIYKYFVWEFISQSSLSSNLSLIIQIKFTHNNVFINKLKKHQKMVPWIWRIKKDLTINGAQIRKNFLFKVAYYLSKKELKQIRNLWESLFVFVCILFFIHCNVLSDTTIRNEILRLIRWC